jgi:hypothetical protein
MAISIKPVVKTFKLLSDPEGVAEIVVRQATQGDAHKRMDLFKKSSRVYREDEWQVNYEYNSLDQVEVEVWLTLESILGVVDDEGNELFGSHQVGSRMHSAPSLARFKELWNSLPVDVAAEIHDKVIEMNPEWGSF